MIEELQKQYLILEDKRKKLYDLLEELDEEQLNFRPAEDKWSITQIIFHLVKAEQLTVISINKEMRNADNHKAGISAFIRSSLLKYALMSSLKFKAPAIMGNIPKEYDINELKTKWVTVRNKLDTALGEVDTKLGKKYLFTHPYAGKLNIYQTMDFLVNHFNHHNRQIVRLAKEGKSKVKGQK
jgi:uncharacterized damage-inducible protein DinB